MHDERDPAEYTEASEQPTTDTLDTDADKIRELAQPHFLGPPAIQRILVWYEAGKAAAANEQRNEDLRLIAAALWSKGDANIRLAALAFVGGLSCAQGQSMSAWAKKLGCTRSAISKEANKWSDKLSMRSSAMKSQQARDSYHRRQVAASKKQPSASSS